MLTVAFAGFTTIGFGAELLVMLIATVALKKLLAAKTFHRVRRTSNTHVSHTRSTAFGRPAKKTNAKKEEKMSRKRAKKTKKTAREENRIFKSPQSLHFQIGALKRFQPGFAGFADFSYVIC